MFEEAIPTLLSILSLSIGGVSIATIISSFVVLAKKIKSVSLTKEYVEQAFEKAVLPANVRIDISQKIMPMVKDALVEIKNNTKEYLQENLEEINKMKTMMILVLTILSKFSHTQQLTEEEQALLKDLLNCTDEVKEIEL